MYFHDVLACPCGAGRRVVADVNELDALSEEQSVFAVCFDAAAEGGWAAAWNASLSLVSGVLISNMKCDATHPTGNRIARRVQYVALTEVGNDAFETLPTQNWSHSQKSDASSSGGGSSARGATSARSPARARAMSPYRPTARGARPPPSAARAAAPVGAPRRRRG